MSCHCDGRCGHGSLGRLLQTKAGVKAGMGAGWHIATRRAHPAHGEQLADVEARLVLLAVARVTRQVVQLVHVDAVALVGDNVVQKRGLVGVAPKLGLRTAVRCSAASCLRQRMLRRGQCDTVGGRAPGVTELEHMMRSFTKRSCDASRPNASGPPTFSARWSSMVPLISSCDLRSPAEAATAPSAPSPLSQRLRHRLCSAIWLQVPHATPPYHCSTSVGDTTRGKNSWSNMWLNGPWPRSWHRPGRARCGLRCQAM